MKKLEIIGKIMVPILFVVLIGLFITNEKEQRENQELLEQQADYIQSVKREMTQKEAEIQEQKEQREAELNTKVSIVLCMNQMSSELYTEVKPLLDDYELKAVFVIQNGQLPGSEGMITKKQYEELLKDGWEVAIGNWDDLDLSKEEDRQIWEQRLEELMNNTELRSVPKAYYFQKNTYEEECAEILKEKGIEVICHFGEAASFYGLDWNEDGNFVGVYPVSQSNMELEEVIGDWEKHGAAIVLSTRYVGTLENTSLDCSISSYRTILDTIQEWKDDGRIEVLTLSELYESRLQTYQEANEADDSYIEELRQNQIQLQTLKEEWDAIFTTKTTLGSNEEETESTEEKSSEERETTTEEETTKKKEDKKEASEEETDEEEKDEEETKPTERLNANFSAEE